MVVIRERQEKKTMDIYTSAPLAIRHTCQITCEVSVTVLGIAVESAKPLRNAQLACIKKCDKLLYNQ